MKPSTPGHSSILEYWNTMLTFFVQVNIGIWWHLPLPPAAPQECACQHRYPAKATDETLALSSGFVKPWAPKPLSPETSRCRVSFCGLKVKELELTESKTKTDLNAGRQDYIISRMEISLFKLQT